MRSREVAKVLVGSALAVACNGVLGIGSGYHLSSSRVRDAGGCDNDESCSQLDSSVGGGGMTTAKDGGTGGLVGAAGSGGTLESGGNTGSGGTAAPSGLDGGGAMASGGSGGVTASGGSGGVTASGGGGGATASGGSGGVTASGGSGGATGGTGGSTGSSGGSGGSTGVGGPCQNGNYQCSGNTSQVCTNGAWTTNQVCGTATCVVATGLCGCVNHTYQCSNNTSQVCTNGVWTTNQACSSVSCVMTTGKCGVCTNGDRTCSQTTPEVCTDGAPVASKSCSGSTPACLGGTCVECDPSAKDCTSNNTPRSCDKNGNWVTGSPCSGLTTCSGGACVCNLTTCGTLCTDTTTDSNNCGACEHSCQNGACTGGKCQPVVLEANQSKPWGITVDATNVYWVDQGNNTISKYTLATGESALLDIPEGNCTLAQGATISDGTNLYWSAVDVCKLAGGTVSDLAANMYSAGSGALTGVAVSGSTVFVVDPSDSFIENSTGGYYFYMQASVYGIAADADAPYWLERSSAGGSIKVGGPFQTGQSTATTLATGVNVSEGIAVYNHYVYWTDSPSTSSASGAVYRVSTTPGGSTGLIASGQTNPSGIAVDASGVYWTNRTTTGGSVMMAPLAGGAAVALATGQPDPHGIALDAKTVYFTNTAGGQVMKVAK